MLAFDQVLYILCTFELSSKFATKPFPVPHTSAAFEAVA